MFVTRDSYGEIDGFTKWALIIPIILIIGVSVFLAFSVKVKPAEVVISVDLYGDNQGVQANVLPTGRQFYNAITHDVIKYPAYVQAHKFEDVAFKDTDGLSVSINISVDYKFMPDKIPGIYTTYRQDADTIKTMYFDKWLKDSVVRTVSGKYNAEKLYSSGMNEFKEDVLKSLRERFEKEGIEVRDVYVEDLKLPQNIVAQIQEKINATQIAQRKENELQATNADVAKQVAVEEGKAKSRIIEAESKAKSNELLKSSLTKEIIEFKRLELQKDAIDKWDGKLPTVSGDTGGMILDLNQVK